MQPKRVAQQKGIKCFFCTQRRVTDVGMWEHIEQMHEAQLKKAILERKLPVKWVTWLSNRRLKATGFGKYAQEP